MVLDSNLLSLFIPNKISPVYHGPQEVPSHRTWTSLHSPSRYGSCRGAGCRGGSWRIPSPSSWRPAAFLKVPQWLIHIMNDLSGQGDVIYNIVCIYIYICICMCLYIYIHNNRCVYIYYSQENFALLVDMSNNYITIHNYVYIRIYIYRGKLEIYITYHVDKQMPLTQLMMTNCGFGVGIPSFVGKVGIADTLSRKEIWHINTLW